MHFFGVFCRSQNLQHPDSVGKPCVVIIAGWTDAKGLFIVYPTEAHAAKAKELIPKYVAWKAVEKVCMKRSQPFLFHRTCSNIPPCMNWSQVELAKGTSKEELLNNPYYDAEAIHFIENVFCQFMTEKVCTSHRDVYSQASTQSGIPCPATTELCPMR